MINLKTKDEINILREAGRINALIMEELLSKIQADIKAKIIDNWIVELCRKFKVEPAFLGYSGYEYNSCVCVNEDIVHCIPSDRVLNKGDILTIDFGIKYKGYYSDHARTVIVEDDCFYRQRFIDAVNMCLSEAIKMCADGNYLGDIGYIIQKTALSYNLGVIAAVGGHGIGKELHEDPFIPNWGFKGEGIVLVEGMVFAIEPIVCEKECSILTLDDGWTVSSDPPNTTAHCEDVIAITKEGPEILTRI